ILFKGQYPPPGYIFVPAGNIFITRHCRDLAKKTSEDIYAYYRHKSKKKSAKQEGLYVPKDIFEKVKSEYERRKTLADEKVLRSLTKNYPNMPPADKAKIFQRCCDPETLKPMMYNTHNVVYSHIRDRYTAFKSVSGDKASSKGVNEAHRQAEEILSNWKGK
ncbi:unnamed protein product, partial [Clonostachys rhizophaga]